MIWRFQPNLRYYFNPISDKKNFYRKSARGDLDKMPLSAHKDIRKTY